MPYTVLIPNVISIILLLILVINVRIVVHNTIPFDFKIFLIMIACNIFQCLGEMLAYSIEGIMSQGFYAFNLVVNSLLFIVNIIFSVLWVVYSDYRINENTQLIKKRIFILAIPATIIVVMSIVNLFVPVFFRITSENRYERTNLFFIPYLITYFYLAYGTIFIYLNKRNAKKYMFLPAIVFMIPILAGSIVQFFFYGFSTVWTGVAIALVSLYLSRQNDVSYVDKLSGVYSRRYMYEYLQKVVNKKKSEKKILGIMLDIDNFKKINDTYGHLVGDEAINNAGKLLHSSLPNSLVSRYGGDEFFVIKIIKSEDDIDKLFKIIENAEEEFATSSGKEYSIHFSKGYSVFDYENDTIDSFLGRVDKSMYCVKKERKIKEMNLNK